MANPSFFLRLIYVDWWTFCKLGVEEGTQSSDADVRRFCGENFMTFQKLWCVRTD